MTTALERNPTTPDQPLLGIGGALLAGFGPPILGPERSAFVVVVALVLMFVGFRGYLTKFCDHFSRRNKGMFLVLVGLFVIGAGAYMVWRGVDTRFSTVEQPIIQAKLSAENEAPAIAPPLEHKASPAEPTKEVKTPPTLSAQHVEKTADNTLPPRDRNKVASGVANDRATECITGVEVTTGSKATIGKLKVYGCQYGATADNDSTISIEEAEIMGFPPVDGATAPN